MARLEEFDRGEHAPGYVVIFYFNQLTIELL